MWQTGDSAWSQIFFSTLECIARHNHGATTAVALGLPAVGVGELAAAAAAPAPAFGQEGEKTTPSTVHLPSYANPQPLDNLVLATQPLMQRGVARSAQKPQCKLPPGVWPFRPARDTFRHDALLDLRGLNEKVAGQSGFVRLADDGESFVLGNGEPVRFWGVTTYVQRDRSPQDLGPPRSLSRQARGQHGPPARPHGAQGQERPCSPTSTTRPSTRLGSSSPR